MSTAMPNSGLSAVARLDQHAAFLFGIDEAGRGPLAGPIAFGACKCEAALFSSVEKRFGDFPFGKDSKQLTEEERNFWFDRLIQSQKESLVEFDVAFAGPEDIDALGLTLVSRRLIKKLLRSLKADPFESVVYLDGGLRAPKQFRHQQTIIKGDEKVFLITLASIAAKVLRDRKMQSLAKKYANYGFEQNKGYPTPAHFEALRVHGISPIHRKRFLVKWGLRQAELANF